MMVGRAISQTYPKVDCTPGETVLEVTDLVILPSLPISASACAREKFSALRPGGRRTHRADAGALRCLAPLLRRDPPERQEPCAFTSPPTPSARASSACRKSGRNRERSSPRLSPRNISLPQLSKLNPNGVLNDAREWRLADEYASRLQVKAFSWRQPVETLRRQPAESGDWQMAGDPARGDHSR